MLLRHPAAAPAPPTPSDVSPRHAVRRFLHDRLAVPPWILLVQLFIGAGWLRAAIEKIIDPAWWNGTALTGFLATHVDTALPWYRPFAETVVVPNALAISVVVVVAQLFAAATMLSGRKLLAGIAVGAFLNLNFVAIGEVDPSIFYLICQAAILLWALQSAKKRTLRLLATGSAGLVALNLPFVSTLDPHAVIEDPAIILVTLGVLVAITSGLAVHQSRRIVHRSARRA